MSWVVSAPAGKGAQVAPGAAVRPLRLALAHRPPKLALDPLGRLALLGRVRVQAPLEVTLPEGLRPPLQAPQPHPLTVMPCRVMTEM